MCVECGTNDTPEWRRNAAHQFLCNACGLRYYKEKRRNALRQLKRFPGVASSEQEMQRLAQHINQIPMPQSVEHIQILYTKILLGKGKMDISYLCN